jgi:hypothetical protein
MDRNLRSTQVEIVRGRLYWMPSKLLAKCKANGITQCSFEYVGGGQVTLRMDFARRHLVAGTAVDFEA